MSDLEERKASGGARFHFCKMSMIMSSNESSCEVWRSCIFKVPGIMLGPLEVFNK